jgi:gamma-glutamyl:cysteine ligase YbdK (ATP-grasp superfamily)
MAAKMGSSIALLALAGAAARQANDSQWLRERYMETKSLPDVVRMQAMRWRDEKVAA